jgi:Fe2+ or Zn2+ uptake regulation protein
MDLETRLVEQGARVFASIAAGRRPALPDPFTARLIADALRAKADMPEPIVVPTPVGPNKGRWKDGIPYRDAIITALRKFPEGLTWDAVMEKSGLKRSVVFKQLNALQAAGVIHKDEHRVYRLVRESQWGGARPGSGPKPGKARNPSGMPMTAQRQRVIDVLVAAGADGISPSGIAAKIPETTVDSVQQQLIGMRAAGQASRRGIGLWVYGDKGGYGGPEQRRKPVPGGRPIPGRTPKHKLPAMPTGEEADRALAILTAVGLGIRPAAPEPNPHYINLLMAVRAEPELIFTPQLLAPLGKYQHGTASGGVYSAIAKFVDAKLLERVKPGHYKLGPAGK